MGTLGPWPRPSSLRAAPFAMLVAVPWAVACGGDEFTARHGACDAADCDGGAGARAAEPDAEVSAGGASHGGAGGAPAVSSGGAGGRIPDGGTETDGGGMLRDAGPVEGGAPADGTRDAAPDDGGGRAFPTTGILDDFNRADGDPGLSWIGSDTFSVKANTFFCLDCASAALWAAPFGADQEVFATLASFDSDSREVNLILKAQDSADCELIEVLYSPTRGEARVDQCLGGSWSTKGSVAAFLEPGDQFGGRAYADGSIELFVNGKTIARFALPEYPYATGRIGVDGISGDLGLRWDDFGGGNWK